MRQKVNFAIGALFGCVLGLGASLTVQDSSISSIASAPLHSGEAQAKLVLGLTLSKAHANSHLRKKKRAKIRRRKLGRNSSTTEPEAKEERLEEDTWRATLPTSCVYDSYASASSGANAYICDGVQYRKSQRNGVTGYEVVKP